MLEQQNDKNNSREIRSCCCGGLAKIDSEEEQNNTKNPVSSRVCASSEVFGGGKIPQWQPSDSPILWNVPNTRKNGVLPNGKFEDCAWSDKPTRMFFHFNPNMALIGSFLVRALLGNDILFTWKKGEHNSPCIHTIWNHWMCFSVQSFKKCQQLKHLVSKQNWKWISQKCTFFILHSCLQQCQRSINQTNMMEKWLRYAYYGLYLQDRVAYIPWGGGTKTKRRHPFFREASGLQMAENHINWSQQLHIQKEL